MEQSPSWEANWFSAGQEIPRILWNPKVHYRIQECPPPVPIRRLCLRIHFNFISFWRKHIKIRTNPILLYTVRCLKTHILCLTSSELDVVALRLEVLEPSQLGPLNNAILKLRAYSSAEEKNAWSFHCHAFHVTSRCDACAHREV
jgi:hypothetical protein